MRRMLIAMTMAAAVSGAAASLAAASGGPAKLGLRQTRVGTILVSSRGFSLYTFTRDTRNHDSCAQIKHCLSLWPVVATRGRPVAGKGVNPRLIGTITLRGGTRQITYGGHPLYTYVADTGPGQTFYVNFSQFGGRWPALNAAGKEVK